MNVSIGMNNSKGRSFALVVNNALFLGLWMVSVALTNAVKSVGDNPDY